MRIFRFIFFLTVVLGKQICLEAWDDTPDCFKEFEVTFFNEKYVSEALSLYTIGQSDWTPISIELQRKGKEVPEKMKAQGNKMDRNPTDNPFQPEEATKLLKSILFEIFVEVMRSHKTQYTNESVVSGMFDYIWNKQEKRLKACLPMNLSEHTK